MTLASTLTQRAAAWCELLSMHGYELVGPVRIEIDHGATGRLSLRARRPTIYGGPLTIVDVQEVWTKGPDPHGLMPGFDGHYTARASWHAQIGGRSATDAERLDFDPRKPPALALHRHPLGAPNHVRDQTTINTPAAWLKHIEHLIIALPGQED